MEKFKPSSLSGLHTQLQYDVYLDFALQYWIDIKSTCMDDNIIKLKNCEGIPIKWLQNWEKNVNISNYMYKSP